MWYSIPTHLPWTLAPLELSGVYHLLFWGFQAKSVLAVERETFPSTGLQNQESAIQGASDLP